MCISLCCGCMDISFKCLYFEKMLHLSAKAKQDNFSHSQLWNGSASRVNPHSEPKSCDDEMRDGENIASVPAKAHRTLLGYRGSYRRVFKGLIPKRKLVN
ncbi:hypothetical protein F2P81_010880 [Scophthalmus maximus]|uniref:Uncharacterized protein n=1 Tax=Scophthalmus maximus TaxID=52904 RepID=A0A6A4SS31_SCOMX|nr:hypothetical protein F2P81_010880 [Scophthalmus maximus]